MIAYHNQVQVEIARVDYFRNLSCENAFSQNFFPNRSCSDLVQMVGDALLPKLISGELRIKDAETLLKERGL
jgi:hypothetical protein